MCRMLHVSRQGFYQWRDRPPSQRQRDDAALTERIRKIHAGHDGRVGVRRVHDELRRAGVACAHKRVHRLMRAAGLPSSAVRGHMSLIEFELLLVSGLRGRETEPEGPESVVTRPEAHALC
jgi:hypothetical protein